MSSIVIAASFPRPKLSQFDTTGLCLGRIEAKLDTEYKKKRVLDNRESTKFGETATNDKHRLDMTSLFFFITKLGTIVHFQKSHPQ
jgi:hypothetical protein